MNDIVHICWDVLGDSFGENACCWESCIMVYGFLSSFGVNWSYGGESGASSQSQVGIGEALPMVMVTVWYALVLWWGSEARWTRVFMNVTACIISQF